MKNDTAVPVERIVIEQAEFWVHNRPLLKP